MAAAIQDNGRGQVIGESTVGKGVEQQLINLADGSQLRLVFRKWLTPNGNNISADSPIKPNIVISDYTAQTDKAYELLK
jgi:carboxyl-terminal processing protease